MQAMTIELQIEGDRPRRWYGQLSMALSRAGLPCSVRPVPHAVRQPLPPGLDILLWIDRTLHGPGVHALDPVPLPTSAGSAASPLAVIDLTGGLGEHVTAPRHLVPLFDGAPGEGALWSALLDGRAPRLDLYDASQRSIIAIGLPATEAPHQLMVSADQVMARLIQGIVRTVRHNEAGTAVRETDLRPTQLPPTQSFSALADILAGKTRRALSRRLGGEPRWRVAWRSGLGSTPLTEEGVFDPTQWTVLPDDGQRYYADPYAFAHEGRRFLFVEEFPYATRRGLISVAEIGADGRALTVPRPVLDAPFHLSYPQVFEHDGAIYMLPEAAASGRLTLYRAVRFPDCWEAVGDLLNDRVHDATLLKSSDGFWLFATIDGDGGSSWDALHLYHAPDLLGPWSAHDLNPVLVDAGAARPAGALIRSGGRLWRPVQDCREGYGAGLGFARIDRLDGRGFAQTVVGTLRPPPMGGLAGVHTWSHGAGLEALDFFGP